MVTDEQVRRLFEMDARGVSKETAAARAGMCPKTARRYRQAGKLPSEMKNPRTWRTWKDAFEEVWPWCREQLELNPGLYATTLFDHLQRMHPGKFQDGQLRTYLSKNGVAPLLHTNPPFGRLRVLRTETGTAQP